MKIGILTHPLELNYGGTLQAFALQKTLLNMGFNAVTIDRHNRREYPSLGRHIASYFKRQFEYYFKGKDVCTRWNPFITDKEYDILSSNTQKFIEKNIRLTRSVYSDELEKIDNEYLFDAYIVGSDQVWLDSYCPNSFLDFVHRPNVKKLVYAASCNEKNALFKNPKKIKICRRLAKDFCGISVREKHLVPISRDKLGVDAEWVLDPTLLLTPLDYLDVIDLIETTNPIVFSYMLDDSSVKRNFVSSIAHELKLPVVEGNLIGKINGYVRRIEPYPSIDNWINNLNRSKFVVTDSFHGAVFSILFNKPFVVLVNEKRGYKRFESLLSLFGLGSRLIKEGDVVNIKYLINSDIDFDYLNSILTEERNKSVSYIINKLTS